MSGEEKSLPGPLGSPDAARSNNPFRYPMKEVPMESRNHDKQAPKATTAHKPQPKPKIRIVKLEQRIAPRLSANHNETLVREPAKAKPKDAKPKKAVRLQIVRLEGRIAPGYSLNHNETLVRARSANAR